MSAESAVVLWPCSIGTLPSAGMVVVVLLMIYCCYCRPSLQPAGARFACLMRPTELDPHPGSQLGGPLRLPCRSAGWLLAWLSATRVRLVSLGPAVVVRLGWPLGYAGRNRSLPAWSAGRMYGVVVLVCCLPVPCIASLVPVPVPLYWLRRIGYSQPVGPYPDRATCVR